MRKIFCFFLAGILLSPLTFASELEDNFAELSQEILTELQEIDPVVATERGIHKYDRNLPDYSSRGVRKAITDLRKFEKRLHNYKYSSLSEHSKINWKLLKSNVDLALLKLQKVREFTKNPYMYMNDAVDGIYLILASEYASMDRRLPDIIARMEEVPDHLKQARNNLKKPAPLHIKLSRELITEAKGFYQSIADQLGPQYPDHTDKLKEAVANAVAAMEDYDIFLATIEPGSATAFALGKDDFDYRLEHEHFLDFGSDSLLKIGENMLAKYDSLYDLYGAYLRDSVRTNNDKYRFGCIDKQTVLDYYDWEMGKTVEFIKDHDLMTVPGDIGECKIVETPKFLQNVISSIAYQPPGTFSPAQTGMFYIRPLPDKFDSAYQRKFNDYIQNRQFRSGIVHEAYPGHHFQFQIASKLEDPVRKWQENICYIEGWALYCEEMMFQQGLYGVDPGRKLRVINGIRYRAARIIMDVKLQTGQMTPNEAVKFMFDKFGDEPGDTLALQREINWYSLSPTVPMSYLVGKLQILDLMADYKAREGKNFSLKEFHDKYLNSGMLPPPLLRESWGF